MTEEQALDESVGKSAAALGDEGSGRPRAAAVDRPREELLTATALAAKEHRHVGVRHPERKVERFAHAGALGHDLGTRGRTERLQRLELAGLVLHLRLQLPFGPGEPLVHPGFAFESLRPVEGDRRQVGEVEDEPPVVFPEDPGPQAVVQVDHLGPLAERHTEHRAKRHRVDAGRLVQLLVGQRVHAHHRRAQRQRPRHHRARRSVRGADARLRSDREGARVGAHHQERSLGVHQGERRLGHDLSQPLGPALPPEPFGQRPQAPPRRVAPRRRGLLHRGGEDALVPGSSSHPGPALRVEAARPPIDEPPRLGRRSARLSLVVGGLGQVQGGEGLLQRLGPMAGRGRRQRIGGRGVVAASQRHPRSSQGGVEGGRVAAPSPRPALVVTSEERDHAGLPTRVGHRRACGARCLPEVTPSKGDLRPQPREVVLGDRIVHPRRRGPCLVHPAGRGFEVAEEKRRRGQVGEGAGHVPIATQRGQAPRRLLHGLEGRTELPQLEPHGAEVAQSTRLQVSLSQRPRPLQGLAVGLRRFSAIAPPVEGRAEGRPQPRRGARRRPALEALPGARLGLHVGTRGEGDPSAELEGGGCVPFQRRLVAGDRPVPVPRAERQPAVGHERRRRRAPGELDGLQLPAGPLGLARAPGGFGGGRRGGRDGVGLVVARRRQPRFEEQLPERRILAEERLRIGEEPLGVGGVSTVQARPRDLREALPRLGSLRLVAGYMSESVGPAPFIEGLQASHERGPPLGGALRR